MGEISSPYEHSFDIKRKTVTYEPQKAIGGTKFLLYVQPPWSGPDWSTPEVITVSANNIAPGPEDDRFKVVDAKDKIPYGDRNFPPWNGQVYAKAVPDAQGNFTHYQPRMREFNCCVMYATVRRVLDVWEGFFGQHIPWHFENYMKKMELIPQIEWDNAQSGYGFLEFGFGSDASGNIDHSRPYCQNFDVLSHELGHSLIFSIVGFPENGQETDDFGGFHESAGDLVALITSLHFKTMVDRLLDRTKGDLFSRNELSRLGELSASREIRLAFNDETMMTVSDEAHDRSLPLTGAIFDIFVEVFQYTLVKNNLISQELAARSFNDNKPLDAREAAEIRNAFTQAYTGNENEFKNALIIARDYLGKALAYTWKNLKANNFTYGMIALGLLEADLVITQGSFHSTIQSCFSWRKIKIDPRRSLLFHRNQVATRW